MTTTEHGNGQTSFTSVDDGSAAVESVLENIEEDDVDDYVEVNVDHDEEIDEDLDEEIGEEIDEEIEDIEAKDADDVVFVENKSTKSGKEQSPLSITRQETFDQFDTIDSADVYKDSLEEDQIEEASYVGVEREEGFRHQHQFYFQSLEDQERGRKKLKQIESFSVTGLEDRAELDGILHFANGEYTIKMSETLNRDNELRILAILSHPSIPVIVKLFENWYKGDGLVFRKYPNSTFQPKPGMKENILIHLFKELLETLKFTHSKGIIHGSVRSSSIRYLEEERKLILSDWDYSSAIGEDLRMHWKYIMAPEVLLGKTEDIGGGVDVWCVALLFIHLFYGIEEPFGIKNWMSCDFCLRLIISKLGSSSFDAEYLTEDTPFYKGITCSRLIKATVGSLGGRVADKKQQISFINKTLVARPSKRQSSSECLEDPLFK